MLCKCSLSCRQCLWVSWSTSNWCLSILFCGWSFNFFNSFNFSRFFIRLNGLRCLFILLIIWLARNQLCRRLWCWPIQLSLCFRLIYFWCRLKFQIRWWLRFIFGSIFGRWWHPIRNRGHRFWIHILMLILSALNVI